MRTFARSLGFLKTCMVIALLLLPTMAFAAEPIKIGLMCPIVGQWASEGQEMERVVSTLVEEVNKAGGIKGRPIELIVEDDAGDPRTAALAAQKLVSSGVIAIIGTYGSAVTEASQNLIDEAGVLQIATGSTSIRLTDKGLPLFFRTCPRDDDQGRVAAGVILKNGYKRVALMHDNSTFSKGLASETRDALKKAGVEIVFFDALTPGERDYTATLTKLKSAKPELLFYAGYYPEAGTLMRQRTEMNWDLPMMGGDGTNNLGIVEIAGKKAAEGFVFVSPPLPTDLKNPEAVAFVKQFRAKYNEDPNSMYAVVAGCAFNVIVEAMKNGAAPEAKAIAKYLKEELKDYPSLSGNISFDKKGDRVGDLYYSYRLDADGKFIIQPREM